MAFDSDVLRLQIGDCWAWCQLFSDVVFTGPSGTMASTSSSRAAPRSAQACMLCYGALFACAAPMASGLPLMMAAPAIGSAAAQSCLGASNAF